MNDEKLVRCDHTDPAGPPTFCIDCYRDALKSAARKEHRRLCELLHALMAEFSEEASGLDIGVLRRYRNSILWSSAGYPSYQFFVDRPLPDQYVFRPGIPPTNLLLPRQLGVPLIFDALEFRLYPLNDDGNQFVHTSCEIIEEIDLGSSFRHVSASRPQGKRWGKRWNLSPHKPLAAPENPRNREESAALREELDARNPACIIVEPERRRIKGFDLIAWRLNFHEPQNARYLAILVGDLWAPPRDEA